MSHEKLLKLELRLEWGQTLGMSHKQIKSKRYLSMKRFENVRNFDIIPLVVKWRNKEQSYLRILNLNMKTFFHQDYNKAEIKG